MSGHRLISERTKWDYGQNSDLSTNFSKLCFTKLCFLAEISMENTGLSKGKQIPLQKVSEPLIHEYEWKTSVNMPYGFHLLVLCSVAFSECQFPS